MIAYFMTRPISGSRLFCGTTPEEVGMVVKAEIDGDEGLSVEEIDPFTVEACEMSQEDIDRLGDFEGW